VEDYSLTAIVIPLVEQGRPLLLGYTITNIGSILARPANVTLDVYDSSDTRRLVHLIAVPTGGILPQEHGRESVLIEHGLPVGQYWGHVTITSVGGKRWEERVVFEIVPQGSIAAKLELRSLSATRQAVAGTVVRIEGTVANVGETPLEAKLIVEIEREGSIIDLLESEPALLLPHEESRIVLYYQPSSPGAYRALSSLAYAGKRSEVQEASFEIVPAASVESLTGLTAAAGERKANTVTPADLILLALAAVSIMVSARIINRRRGRHTPRP
jgi:hypothetical protein